MEGSRRLVPLAMTAALVVVSGCSSFDPKPTPLPFSLYDSPLIAGGVPSSDIAGSTSTETAEPTAEEPSRADAQGGAPKETDTDAPDDTGTDDATETSTGTKPPPTLASTASADQQQQEPTADAAATHDASTASTDAAASADPSFNADAAGYVTAIYELNGVSMPVDTHQNIPALYRHCREAGGTYQSRKPAAGDLAFFHNVADANDDGRNNDWYTLVALVERVDGAGNVHLLGYRNGRVRSFTMNLDHPDAANRAGKVANTQLRKKRSGDAPYTQYLAGQLFAGYCELLGDKSELLVVDNWEPGMELEPPSK